MLPMTSDLSIFHEFFVNSSLQEIGTRILSSRNKHDRLDFRLLRKDIMSSYFKPRVRFRITSEIILAYFHVQKPLGIRYVSVKDGFKWDRLQSFIDLLQQGLFVMDKYSITSGAVHKSLLDQSFEFRYPPTLKSIFHQVKELMLCDVQMVDPSFWFGQIPALQDLRAFHSRSPLVLTFKFSSAAYYFHCTFAHWTRKDYVVPQSMVVVGDHVVKEMLENEDEQSLKNYFDTVHALSFMQVRELGPFLPIFLRVFVHLETLSLIASRQFMKDLGSLEEPLFNKLSGLLSQLLYVPDLFTLGYDEKIAKIGSRILVKTNQIESSTKFNLLDPYFLAQLDFNVLKKVLGQMREFYLTPKYCYTAQGGPVALSAQDLQKILTSLPSGILQTLSIKKCLSFSQAFVLMSDVQKQDLFGGIKKLIICDLVLSEEQLLEILALLKSIRYLDLHEIGVDLSSFIIKHQAHNPFHLPFLKELRLDFMSSEAKEILFAQNQALRTKVLFRQERNLENS